MGCPILEGLSFSMVRETAVSVANAELLTEGDKSDPLIQKLRALKQNFDRCVLANSRASESEKLEPFEFVMDRPLEVKLKAQGDERVAKIKEKAKREIQMLSIVWWVGEA